MKPSLLVPLLWVALAGARLVAQEATPPTPPNGNPAGPASVPGAAQGAVEYTVLLHDPQTQTVDVSVSIRGLSADQRALEIDLPVWRPGRYEVLDQAGAVRNVRARSGSGVSLPCTKVEKSAWMLSTAAANGDDRVIVDYTLYANDLGGRTVHVDDTHAFLDGAAAFMYAPEFRDQPVRVRIEAPEGWQTATGLEAEPADGGGVTLVAPNYDTLIDSPIEVGFHTSLEFEVDKVPHQVVIWTGRRDAGAALGPGYDKPRLIDQLSRMIRAERDIFGEFPFKRYVFLVHCVPGASGGTEHLNSTIMQLSPSVFADEAGSKRFVGLAAHEYFHSWNVKQLRPAGLKPLHGLYDLQHENYTDLLWVAEGTTSYLDQVCLVRAGINKPDDYLKSLSGMIDNLRTRPGASVQSAADSSFDAWVKFTHPSPDSVNSTVSFYEKGAAVSFALDMELRKRTENKASLDTVMRSLYQSFPLDGPGYTTEDLIRACERASGSSFRQFFEDYVQGVRPLDFEAAAAVAGLELTHDSARASGRRDRKAEGDEEPETSGSPDVERAYIGLNLEVRDGLSAVSSVLADGPAYKAGVVAGDVLLALNGQRIRGTDLEPLLKQVKPNDSVKLTLFRYDRLREIEFAASGRIAGKWALRRVSAPGDGAKTVYESWLGQKWPAGGAAKQAPAGTAQK